MHIDAKIALTALEPPDWNGLMLADASVAADALKSILRHGDALLEEAETRLNTIKEHIFNLRMCAFRIVSERELWKLDTDPEYGVPYKSMHRWMQVLYPGDEGLRYAIEANSTQKALPAATLEDLAQMPRCNAVTLASKFVSDGCRKDRNVIEAAKTSSEKQFRETLNSQHGQHLEQPETLKLTYPSGDMASVKTYLQWVSETANLEPDEKTHSCDYSGALLYLAIHENEEHRLDDGDKKLRKALVEDWQQGGHSEDVE